MNWYGLPVVAFDTETTGLAPWEGHRVMEFGAVRFHLDRDGRMDEDGVERFQFLLNPGIPIPREVQNVTHITDEDVKSAPPFQAKAQEIAHLLDGSIAVAHNFGFDRQFLAAELREAGVPWPDVALEVDTLDISRRYYTEANRHGLKELCHRLGVPLPEHHRALNDAEACGRCFLEMARIFAAPAAIEELADWADAIPRPPEHGVFQRGPDGAVLFGEGPFRGEPISRHPEHLAWLLFALERGPRGWQKRYPESVRRWAARWLNVRAGGRAPQGSKAYGPGDWGIDSCTLVD